MSPEQWIVWTTCAALLSAVLAAWFAVEWWRARSAARSEAREHEETIGALKRTMAERDAALQAKSAQFEEWQADTARLRREIAELRDGQWQAFTALNKAQRELALLRPIADAAAALCDGKNLPGEFTALREAIRARKEAGNA